jgi:HEAT repeat protein
MIHQVREAAADSLGQLGDAEAVPALCRSLYDPAGHVAARAAAALGRIRDESAAPALCGVMITGVAATRAEAAGALARIGSDQATQALCRALEDPEGNVRLEAAAGLGGIASSSTHPPIQLRAAVPTLKRLSAPLSTERADIKRACKDALQRIETRTAHIKGLPLPAESAAPSPDTLPRPSHGEEAGE